jgi:hypothetical protein
MLALGGLGFGLYQILWTTGLSRSGGDSALIIASTRCSSRSLLSSPARTR